MCNMRCEMWDLGFGIWDVRYEMWDLGCEIWDVKIFTLYGPFLRIE